MVFCYNIQNSYLKEKIQQALFQVHAVIFLWHSHGQSSQTEKQVAATYLLVVSFYTI
jgi:hypothetical protein